MATRGQILDHLGRPTWQKHRQWLPRDLGGIICEFWADIGSTLGTVPRASGTSPPVLTYSEGTSGALSSGVVPYVQIDSTAGGTGLGQATYKVSYNDGATFPHTGIVTHGPATALPGIGSGILASFAAGTYNVNNVYEALAASALDLSGKGNHPSEAIAANRMIMRAAGWNGRPCFDFGTAGTLGFTTPAVTIGPFSVMVIARGDASSAYAFVTGTDVAANGGYLIGTTGVARSTYVSRTAGGASSRATAANWLRTGAKHTNTQVFDGTHAGHKLYQDGVDISAVSGPETANPGTGTFSAALRIGYSQTKATGFQGIMAGVIVANRPWTAAEVARLHQYAITSRSYPL